MSAMNMPTSMMVMALVAAFNLFTGAFLLFKVKEFVVKAILTAGVFVFAFASKTPELSELLATTMWPVTVAIATVITVIAICDFSRMAVRLDRHNRNRRGARRHHTPAHN